jgi:hypothetical protein
MELVRRLCLMVMDPFSGFSAGCLTCGHVVQKNLKGAGRGSCFSGILCYYAQIQQRVWPITADIVPAGKVLENTVF